MPTRSSKLAIDGGTPVRERPLAPWYPGAAVIGAAEKKAVLQVLEARSPFRYYGPHVLNMALKFEKAIAATIGTRFALGVTSGTAALRVAVEALGIGPGDEVIIPAVTFVASPNAVICARAVPVFADVDDTLSLDPADVERRITKRTRAVMSVPLIGVPPRMDKLRAVARRHGIALIEDVAQSCGASFRGKALGKWGDISTFSLQLNKIITSGDGGAVTTDSPLLYERAVRYHDQGQVRAPHEAALGRLRVKPFAGENYRLNELSAAVALAQVKKLPGILKKMRAIKTKIAAAVKPLGGITQRPSHDQKGDAGSGFTMYFETKEVTDLFIDAVNGENVSCVKLYGGRTAYTSPQVRGRDVASSFKCPWECPVHEVSVDYSDGICPNAEELLARSATIGIVPVYLATDVRDIIKAIRKVHAALLG